MTWLLVGVSAYLTYYTFNLGRKVWRQDNKWSGAAVMLLTTTYLPLAIYFLYFK